MLHIDLFSGIGGFALAADMVWPGIKHVFCDNDKFCQQVLKKHWPNSLIYGDIRTLRSDTHAHGNGRADGKSEINPAETGKQALGNFEKRDGTLANPDRHRPQEPGAELQAGGDRQLSETLANPEGGQSGEQTEQEGREDTGGTDCFILTGGFPCQPFSAAGRRRGTQDDRYLWPEMLRVIREFSPLWVIAENVYGLVTWNEGMVLEQVCSDLEGENYEVQAFIVPAVSVNAPHRRDRVWIVAHRNSGGVQRYERESFKKGTASRSGNKPDATDSERPRWPHRLSGQEQENRARECGNRDTQPNWRQNWLEVATELCGMDDGLPVELDGFELSKAGHRVQRLKSLGNAIVPQVAMELMKTIKLYG